MSCMNYSILNLDWGTNPREMDTTFGVGRWRWHGNSAERHFGDAASQQTTDSSDKHNRRLRHRPTTTTTIASM